MVRAKITSKGQVTLPAEIRRRYGLEAGDEIAFRVDASGLRILPLKKRRLSQFRGLFPATKRFVSRDAIRRDVGRKLGLELERAPRGR